MRFLLVLSILIATILPVVAQKVAQYSIGQYGTKEFELFQFWTDGRIVYQYGPDAKEYTLTTAGKAVSNSFQVRFPNKQVFTISASGNDILVKGTSNAYNKRFKWHYEGPVDGKGTFCSVCAADEKEAMSILRKKYLQ